MDKFWDLLERSVILQATLTLIIWGALLFMVVTERQIPTILETASALILGFYFGAKQAQLTTQLRKQDG